MPNIKLGCVQLIMDHPGPFQWRIQVAAIRQWYPIRCVNGIWLPSRQRILHGLMDIGSIIYNIHQANIGLLIATRCVFRSQNGPNALATGAPP